MDIIYYITGFATIFGLPTLAILLATLLARPKLINKHPRINSPVSRKKIAGLGVTSLVIATMSFGSVLAATEPTNVKADRLAREAAEANSLEINKQQEQNAKKISDEAAAKRKQEEANKPIVRTETKTEAVTFSSSVQNDPNLPLGQQKVSVAGASGERTITYQVTYVNGNETSRNETKNEVTKQPVNQVTLNGTYVAPAPKPAPAPSCPNGTYVNSAGNTVCSPYQSTSTPAGATARCSDGTYSFSQSRRGTCSHHGGVAAWL